MADAVATQILFEGSKNVIMKFTNISDGTGESNVVKVNVSTLTPYQGEACTAVDIDRIFASTHGMEVDIKWQASTNVLCMTVPQNQMQHWDMRDFGGLTNNAGAGKTGNILFSTVDASNGDRYTIVLILRKIYG